jgi:anti-anti-sigma regulatory factor
MSSDELSFEIDARRIANDLYFTITGRIDEHFSVDAIEPCAGKVVVHLGGATSISSAGVRSFERFLEQAAARAPVVLIHVSSTIATQIALLPSLVANAQVQTVRLPFTCPSCGAAGVHAIPWRHDAHRRFAPECACGAAMDLDGAAEQFLPPAPPADPLPQRD